MLIEGYSLLTNRCDGEVTQIGNDSNTLIKELVNINIRVSIDQGFIFKTNLIF